GDHHAIHRPQWADTGHAIELGADAASPPRNERDLTSVGHPHDVILNSLEDAPQLPRTDVDRDCDPQFHASASRSAAAARSGDVVLTNTPVPSSNPAGTVRRGVMRTYQW